MRFEPSGTPGAIAALDETAARAHDPEAACRALTRAAELCLHDLADVHMAALRLEQARRTRPQPGGDAWLRCALAGVDLRVAQGDREGAARLAGRVREQLSVALDVPARLPSPADPDEPVAEQELRVTVELRAGRLNVVTKRYNGETGRLRGTAALKRIRALLDAPTPEALAEGVHANPAALGRDLATLLRDAAGAERLDIGLRAQHPAVRALPWELAAPGLEADGLRLFRRAARTHGAAADLRALQGALGVSVDGAFGPRTLAALKAFQAEHGLGATGRPDPLTIQRLHTHVAGGARPRVAVLEPAGEVAREYARAGFEPAAPIDGSLAILHIRAPLDLHHGSPALRLDRPLTALALDHTLARATPSPLVVLDVPGGEDPLSQLLLRNAFAAELAAVGTVRAILATGRPPGAIVDALKGGQDVYAIAAALRPGDLPPALFARSAALRFPAPRNPAASELQAAVGGS